MKGQHSNRADDTKIIEIIKDHPGIRSCEIAKKLGRVANTIATKTATIAQRAFNVAVKANPIGVLIALLAAAVTAYYFFRDSVGPGGDP